MTRARLGLWWQLVAAGLAFVPAAFVWRRTDAGAVVWVLALAPLLLVALVVGMHLRERHRLAHLTPGVRWAGGSSLRLDEAQATRVGDATSRVQRHALTPVLFASGVLPGVVTVEADGVSWRPSWRARLVGAEAWRVARVEIADVQVVRSPRGIRLLMRDGTRVRIGVDRTRGLPDALSSLGFAGRH